MAVFYLSLLKSYLSNLSSIYLIKTTTTTKCCISLNIKLKIEKKKTKTVVFSQLNVLHIFYYKFNKIIIIIKTKLKSQKKNWTEKLKKLD